MEKKNIEKAVTEEEYKKALYSIKKNKEIVVNYNLNKLKKEFGIPENCNHPSFFRYWYSEDHLINSCRTCFSEWEEKYRPFLLEEYSDLTSGIYRETESDSKRRELYLKRKEEIYSLKKLL